MRYRVESIVKFPECMLIENYTKSISFPHEAIFEGLTQELPHVEEAFSNGSLTNKLVSSQNDDFASFHLTSFSAFSSLKKTREINAVQWKTMGEEKTISSPLP